MRSGPGLRLGELLALKWEDVHVESRSLDVRRNRTRGRVTSTKNRQRRSVDMSLQLTEALRRVLVQKKADSLKAGRALPPWVFTTLDGKPLDGDNLRKRVFARVLPAATLRPIRIHDLRHTYATHLIQQGESLAYVSRQLGHSSIKITVDTYAHWLPNTDRSAVDRLDAVPAAASNSNPGATREQNADASAASK